MSTEIMSSHIQDTFSDAARTEEVLNVIFAPADGVRPAAAFFAEAWKEGQEQLLDYVESAFHENGYAVVKTLYEDDDNRNDRHGMMAVVRNTTLTDRQARAVRLGTRNALYVPFTDPHTGETDDMYFVHLDDRLEARRLGQAAVLLDEVVAPDRPAIIAGKFNAFYRRDPIAIGARAAGPFVRRLPAVDPGEANPTLPRRFASLGQRTAGMATGTTMRKFVEADFEDADPQHRPTKGPFNIDRFMYRGLSRALRVVKRQPLFKDQRVLTAAFQ